MLTIKQIQAALKTEKITLNQTQIGNILVDLNIDINQCEEGHLSQIVDAIKDRKNSTGLAVSGRARTNTLSVPEVPTVTDLADEQKSAERQKATNDAYTEKMLDTAEQISERNLDLVLTLPQLVEVKTLQKLQQAAPEIQRRWDATNDKLANVMFGL